MLLSFRQRSTAIVKNSNTFSETLRSGPGVTSAGAVEGGVGRAAIAPEILYTLWLYATREGVGHARGIARLTQAHDGYWWICGGVQVNDHILADFRSQEGDALDERLTDNVARLMAAGVVKFKAAAQDGMRVRASAGAASFRREDRLNACLEAAREQVATLKARTPVDKCADYLLKNKETSRLCHGTGQRLADRHWHHRGRLSSLGLDTVTQKSRTQFDFGECKRRPAGSRAGIQGARSHLDFSTTTAPLFSPRSGFVQPSVKDQY